MWPPPSGLASTCRFSAIIQLRVWGSLNKWLNEYNCIFINEFTNINRVLYIVMYSVHIQDNDIKHLNANISNEHIHDINNAIFHPSLTLIRALLENMNFILWGVMEVFRTKVIVGTFNSTTTSPVGDESPQSLSLLSEHEGSGHSREHLELFVVRFYLLQGEVGNNLSAEARVTKTPSACQQCWPESFCESGKFLRHAQLLIIG